jgi:hypothetical protein
MSLPTGSWSIDANGFQGTLSIDSVDDNGNVKGSAYGNPIQGFWDEIAQKLSFTRTINPADPSTLQIFTGYMFQSGGSFTVAGSFQAFSGAGAVPTRSVLGWYAQHPT